MSDKFDQEAEALLPCDMPHDSRCPCRYRFAVAARLRADAKVIFQRNRELAQAQAEVEWLKEANEHWHKRVEGTIASEDEIADLRSQLALAQENADYLAKESSKQKFQLAEAGELIKVHSCLDKCFCEHCNWLAAKRKELSE